MFKSINLLFVALLVMLSAQMEIRSWLPDFSDSADSALATLHAENLWTSSPIPSKKDSLRGHIAQVFFFVLFFLAIVPLVKPFFKSDFLFRNQTFSASVLRPFHLLI